MLQENVSEEFKKLFLLEFTKELIKHSLKTEIKLEVAEEGKKDKIKEKVKKAIKKEESAAKKQKLSKESIRVPAEPSIMHPEPVKKFPKHYVLPVARPRVPNIQRPQMKRPVASVQRMPALKPLRIPEPVLPPRLQYLRPTPTNKEIDLGKLNSLVQDPAVRTIQCDGADKNIVVIGSMGIKRTNTILSKDDIDGVFNKFSIAAKIPLQDEGIFRVVFGKLILSAIISKVISSRFIIRKMSYSSRFQSMRGEMAGRPGMPQMQQTRRPDEIIPRGVI